MFSEMIDTISNFDSDRAIELVNIALENQIDPIDILEKGFSLGLRAVGERFGKGEAFLTELVAAANVMEDVTEILVEEMKSSKRKSSSIGLLLIGTVSGDIHSIGKNIVKTLIQANDFDVIDLGEDVPTTTFVEKVRELKPDILGLSALMSTTITVQKEIIDALEKAGIRNNVKIIVGGAAVTEKWSKKIGADGYAENPIDAVTLVKELVSA